MDNHQFSNRLKTCKDGVTSGLRSSGRRCLFLAGFGSWREDELTLLSDISPDAVARPLHGVILVAAVPPGGTDTAEASRARKRFIRGGSGVMARTTSPRQRPSAVDSPAISAGNTRLISIWTSDLNHFLRPE